MLKRFLNNQSLLPQSVKSWCARRPEGICLVLTMVVLWNLYALYLLGTGKVVKPYPRHILEGWATSGMFLAFWLFFGSSEILAAKARS